ncbi:MAG: lauroyl acyltransferase, partial [Alphaproteobacteria bacterium]|nr:lauroyl acyltransferase [Alphaproteobacteria bacterium]
ILPLDAASWLGGCIMRHAGPFLKAHRTAEKNISLALPEKTPTEKKAILNDMWDNLGRTIAEYPHLHHIASRIRITGKEHMEHVRDKKQGTIFFSAHLANWELLAVGAKTVNLPAALVYRKPNNPWVDGLLRRARSSAGGTDHIEKGPAGAKQILSTLRNGGAVGILQDQRLNEGLALPFFGHDAMTATAIAQFALKLGCPLYPTRIQRLKGAHFAMDILPPLDFSPGNNTENIQAEILNNINKIIENWVREAPAQWLWTHKRWPDKIYQ